MRRSPRPTRSRSRATNMARRRRSRRPRRRPRPGTTSRPPHAPWGRRIPPPFLLFLAPALQIQLPLLCLCRSPLRGHLSLDGLGFLLGHVLAEALEARVEDQALVVLGLGEDAGPGV